MPSDAEARIVLKGIDDGATGTIKKTESAMAGLGKTTADTTAKTQAQNIAFIASATALQQVSSGFQMVVRGATELGLVNEKQAALLRTLTAGMQLFVGAGQAIEGVIALVNALRTSEAALAAIKAFQTALIPVVGPILVGVALGTLALVAAKLGGYLQTQPGEWRQVKESGPATVHKGEWIGRAGGPGRSGPGSGVNVTINAGKLDLGSYLDRYLFAKQIAKETRA